MVYCKSTSKCYCVYMICIYIIIICFRDIKEERTLEAALLLCTRMFDKLRDNSQNSLKVLSACVECVLWTAYDLQIHSGSGDNNCKQILSNVFDTLSEELKKWIALKDVIGGSVFGSIVLSSKDYLTSWKGEEELEVYLNKVLLLHVFRYVEAL